MDVVERSPEHLRRLIAGIDRSEQIDVVYEVVDGALLERPGSHHDAPRWSVDGDDHSVTAQVAFCEPVLARGGVLLDGGDGAGVAVVEPVFEPGLAWLAFFHVSRPHRRRGVGTALWRAAADRVRHAGATRMYVSATPTGSAVGFYLRQGCRLADPPHAELLAHEPEDIHLVCELSSTTATA